MSRLFVAVWLPPALVDQLRALDRPARPGLRWTTEDQWHVTLRFLGEVPSGTGLAEVLAELASDFESVTATLGPYPRRLGDRVWSLPVGGLETLARAVHEATVELVPPARPRPFQGHVTLARGRRPGSLRDLPGGRVGGSWTVGEVTLVCSHLHSEGARYEVLERWPIGKEGRIGGRGG